jgi:dCTP deaminase
MAFWSGEKLAKNRLVISDFSDAQVDANAYNLKMGASYFRTSDNEEGKQQKKNTLTPGESFIIPAGQFAFLVSRETINVPPDAMAFISMRTGIKFQGLINVSGFHVDPGYKGKLIYAAYNASPSPIQICEGDEIFKIWFAELNEKSSEKHLFDGKPQNDISNELIRGMSKEIYSLQNLAEKMRDIESNVSSKIRDIEMNFNSKISEQKPVLDNLTFVWRTITLGVIGAIIIALLALALPSLKLLGADIGDWVSSKMNSDGPIGAGSQKTPSNPPASSTEPPAVK